MQMEPRLFDYMISKHARVLGHIDALDQKIAQAIAANGLVLSFVFDKMMSANSQFVFIVGMVLIISSIGLAFGAYKTKTILDDPKPEFFRNKKNNSNDLEGHIIDCLEHNKQILNQKAGLFNISLLTSFVGLVCIVGGYYV